jgi:hypothetical protein
MRRRQTDVGLLEDANRRKSANALRPLGPFTPHAFCIGDYVFPNVTPDTYTIEVTRLRSHLTAGTSGA